MMHIQFAQGTLCPCDVCLASRLPHRVNLFVVKNRRIKFHIVRSATDGGIEVGGYFILLYLVYG